MRSRFCLAIVAFIGLMACGRAPVVSTPASPAFPSPVSASPSPASTPSPSPAAGSVLLATDSYPGAPRVNNGYLGNGIYGNALVVNNTGPEPGAWYWDGKRWIRTKGVDPTYFTTRPVFDPALRKSVVLAGGATGDGFTTWAWNGSSWSLLGEGPVGDGPALLGYDPATKQLIALVGNPDWKSTSTWVFDCRRWQRAGGSTGPDARIGAGFAFDPMTRQFILHGGILAQSPGYRTTAADTWTWNGKTWTEQHPTDNPPPGWDSLAYDPDSHRLILMNVAAVDEFTPTQISMWSWAGANWHRLNPQHLPAIGYLPDLAYDLANHQFLLFEATMSGKDGSQTWVLAKNTWKRVG